MIPSPGSRWTSLAVGALVALLAGVLAAPSVARAGCGDYVMVGKRHDSRVTHTPTHGDHVSPAPHHGRKPCSGPNCTRGQLPPLAPPAAPPVVGETWGYLTATLQPGLPEANRQPIPDDHARPIRTITPVYHPPRPFRSGPCA